MTEKDWKIVDVRSQYSIRQLLKHSVILDVYAKDEKGALIHLEIQNKDNDEHLKRTRYCRSCIDTMLLDSGLKYKKLPNIWQIFITKKDFLKEQMKGESEMCEIFDAVRKDGRDEGIEVARKEDISNLMKSLSLSLEDACKALGLRASDYKNILTTAAQS